MKFIDPSFDILTDISYGGIKELSGLARKIANLPERA